MANATGLQEIYQIGEQVLRVSEFGLILSSGHRGRCDCCFNFISEEDQRIKIPEDENPRLRGRIFCLDCAKIRTGYEESEVYDTYIEEGVTNEAGDLIDEDNPPEMFYETEMDKEQYIESDELDINPDGDQVGILISPDVSTSMVLTAMQDRIKKVMGEPNIGDEVNDCLESSFKTIGHALMLFPDVGINEPARDLLDKINGRYLYDLAKSKCYSEADPIFGHVIHDLRCLNKHWLK